ncbi:hypothetical protein AMTRI_Chr05g70200 [Amborella trichopoda]
MSHSSGVALHRGVFPSTGASSVLAYLELHFLERSSIIVLFFLFDDTLPRFLLRQVCHGRLRSLDLFRGWSSKTSPPPLPTTIPGGNVLVLFHYAPDLRDFVTNLLLLLRVSCLLEKTMPLLQISESNRMRMFLTSVWKMLKLNWLNGWHS